MASARIQFLGLTRWSYPFWSDAFRRAETELDALRAQLYAPRRLDHRLFLLEHLVLPCLRAQTDPDFTHLFLMGDQLPDPWRSRVLALTADIPQIRPVFRPEGEKHKDLCRAVMKEHLDPACDVTAQYRLDDDDAVGVNYIETSRNLFAQLQPFYEQSGKIALDFTRGFILSSSPEDVTMRPISMRFWAPGMTIFQAAENREALLDYHHLRIWHDMPTLTWRDEPMFIRGAHHDNDSGLSPIGRRTRTFPFKNRTPERYFKRRFGLDLPQVQELWKARKSDFLDLPSLSAPAEAAE